MEQTRSAAKVNAVRAFDAVYDPIYTAPHQPASLGLTSVQKVAEWKNFFSASPQVAPPHRYRLKNVTTVSLPAPQPPPGPAPGSVANAGLTSTSVGTSTNAKIDLVGRDRPKFFKRPIVAMSGLTGQPDPNLVFTAPQPIDAVEFESLAHTLGSQQQPPQSKSRTVGTQTKYRESDSQTDPWSPDFKLVPGQPAPEVLSIAHLTYGKGLPAAMEEVKLIERLRERKRLEASLPTGNDDASFEMRKKMMRSQELKDWEIREAEIRTEQEQRLQQLVVMLKAREQQTQAYLDKRVAEVRERQNKARDAALQAIHRQRVKGERAIGKSQLLETKSNKRDVIAEYVDKGSRVYAPVMHEGIAPTQQHIPAFEVAVIKNFQGLSSLQETMHPSVLEPAIKSPDRVVPPTLQTRRGQQMAKDLYHVDGLIQTAKNREAGTLPEKEVTENVYKHLEPLLRPPTPTVEDEESAEEDTHAAIVFLQRLLRGRAVQNVMYAGRVKNQQLIAELREQMGSEEQADYERAEQELIQNEMLIELLQGALFAAHLPPFEMPTPSIPEDRPQSTRRNLTVDSGNQSDYPTPREDDVPFDGGVDINSPRAVLARKIALGEVPDPNAFTERVDASVETTSDEMPRVENVSARTQFKNTFADSLIFQAIRNAAGSRISTHSESADNINELSAEHANPSSDTDRMSRSARTEADQSEDATAEDPNVSRSIVDELLSDVVLPEVQRRQTLKKPIAELLKEVPLSAPPQPAEAINESQVQDVVSGDALPYHEASAEYSDPSAERPAPIAHEIALETVNPADQSFEAEEVQVIAAQEKQAEPGSAPVEVDDLGESLDQPASEQPAQPDAEPEVPQDRPASPEEPAAPEPEAVPVEAEASPSQPQEEQAAAEVAESAKEADSVAVESTSNAEAQPSESEPTVATDSA